MLLFLIINLTFLLKSESCPILPKSPTINCSDPTTWKNPMTVQLIYKTNDFLNMNNSTNVTLQVSLMCSLNDSGHYFFYGSKENFYITCDKSLVFLSNPSIFDDNTIDCHMKNEEKIKIRYVLGPKYEFIILEKCDETSDVSSWALFAQKNLEYDFEAESALIDSLKALNGDMDLKIPSIFNINCTTECQKNWYDLRFNGIRKYDHYSEKFYSKLYFFGFILLGLFVILLTFALIHFMQK